MCVCAGTTFDEHLSLVATCFLGVSLQGWLPWLGAWFGMGTSIAGPLYIVKGGRKGSRSDDDGWHHGMDGCIASYLASSLASSLVSYSTTTLPGTVRIVRKWQPSLSSQLSRGYVAVCGKSWQVVGKWQRVPYLMYSYLFPRWVTKTPTLTHEPTARTLLGPNAFHFKG